MNLLPFEKYQATGNDFIILDCMEANLINYHDTSLIQKMCDRRFGIGADGLLALLPIDDYDFKMLYYNSDGNPSTFCGNGSRCAVSYILDKIQKHSVRFKASDGPHKAIRKNGLISVHMKDIQNYKETDQGFFVQTGSPHLIVEEENIEQLNVAVVGRKIREEFSEEGANVNFIKYNNDVINIRTYERGVEDETLSCGTGITAAAYYVAIKEKKEGFPEFLVKSRGGNLTVNMKLTKSIATEVHLIGPAVRVYSGFYELPKQS